MSVAYGPECPKCGTRPRLRLETNGAGHLVETLIDGCEHARKRYGMCKSCPRPVYGKVGVCLRCVDCYREQQRKWNREDKRKQYKADPEKQRKKVKKWRDANPEKIKQQREQTRNARRLWQKRRRWADHPVYLAQLERQRAKYHNDPEYREKRLAFQREYRARKRAEREAQRSASESARRAA